MKKFWQFITHFPVHASAIFLIRVIGLFFSLDVFGPKVALAQKKNLPLYGWYVGEDLGFGEVPGHSPRHRFLLYNQSGHRLLAFCLNEKLPPPPQGQICERISKDVFWCSDVYQPVKIYELLSTPTPMPTKTATPTATHTPAVTPTPTLTATPGVPSPTPTQRFRLGGQGNLQPNDLTKGTLGIFLIGLGITSALINYAIAEERRNDKS